MQHPHLLHIFSPMKYVSPFDINMAYEAQFDGVIPYCNIELDEVHALTQDTIFSRSPEGVRRTGIFIGGREFTLALDMLNAARAAMVPPFEVSVMADPSGAITTAAAMVALADGALESGGLAGRRVSVFGGTGPVGMCVALLAARAGAECAIVSHQGRGAAQVVADRMARQFDIPLDGIDGSSNTAIASWIGNTEVLFSAARAGVQVLDEAALAGAERLQIAADANAVPPAGIAGIKPKDSGIALAVGGGRSALGFGALAIGDIKYKVHTKMLTTLHESDKPVYLGFAEAYEVAKKIIAGG